ncbi:tetratricopeptide repeat protein [Glaciecola petra]|uniref:PEGA domain-containing protein n=1 Tax=Glaciecola petra TaxID=3075602 RepID=A0ABU2ZSV6_9ALTE|nr:hypothetical protein [Aestuariibacter sp. P117]MDT0595725.1 hypothetical protein [Aestuariibacter sp. P117]
MSAETDKQSADKNSTANQADAQIQAHRKQHQQKMKKLFLGAGLLALVIIIVIVGYQLRIKNDVSFTNTDLAETSLNAQEIEQYRDFFKQAFTHYEVKVQTFINQIELSGWEADKVGDINLLKDQVLSLFAKGAYVQAKNSFQELGNLSNDLISRWQAQTQTYISDAQQYFDNDNMPKAQLSINKALELMPRNSDANALQNRIDAYAEISNLLGDYEVAKIERNLPKQIDLLTNIIDLDPSIGGLPDELAKAQTQHEKNTLANLLEKAQNAFDNERYAEALSVVKQAQKIDPNSQGAKLLQARISAASASDNLSQAKSQLASLAEQDEWAQVSTLAAKALQKAPNDADLKEYASAASKIIGAKKRITGFTSRPNRLADENIRNAATQAITESFMTAIRSPSLQTQIAELAELVDAYSAEVDVTVNSDGESYIVVVGVGHVGAHKQKVIQLTPGEYTLRCTRSGYKNKRLAFVIEANQAITLSLVCDEAI